MRERTDWELLGAWTLGGAPGELWWDPRTGWLSWWPEEGLALAPVLLGRFSDLEQVWACLGWGRGRRDLALYFPSLRLAG